MTEAEQKFINIPGLPQFLFCLRHSKSNLVIQKFVAIINNNMRLLLENNVSITR